MMPDYNLIIFQDRISDGYVWLCYCPEIDWAIAQGDTPEEAEADWRLLLEDLQERAEETGEALPEPALPNYRMILHSSAGPVYPGRFVDWADI